MSLKELFYDWGGLNVFLFHAINQLHGAWYDSIMLAGSILSNRYDFPLYLLLIYLITAHRKTYLASDSKTKWQFVTIFVAAFVLDVLFVETMKSIFQYPRPFVTLSPATMRVIGEPMLSKEYYSSFPSGHASFAALIVASIWPILKRYGKIFGCVFIVWASWSRIALGAHYPVDVLVGIAASVLIVQFVRWAYYTLQKQKHFS